MGVRARGPVETPKGGGAPGGGYAHTNSERGVEQRHQKGGGMRDTKGGEGLRDNEGGEGLESAKGDRACIPLRRGVCRAAAPGPGCTD